MTFEYNKVSCFTDSIDIENPSNCCLVAKTEEGSIYLLIVKTNLGETTIFNFGPLKEYQLDNPYLSPKTSISCSVSKIKWSKSSVDNLIKNFLNLPNIVNVEEEPVEKALNYYIDLVRFLMI